MAFLEKLEAFEGTGARNGAGQTLEEFLAVYDPKKYDCPCNTTDIVVVRCEEKLKTWGQPLKVLLVKRSNHPSIGFWALPGGFVELREDLYQGAARELWEETGVQGLPLMELKTWGEWQRDPRWRIITTSFLALAEGDIPVKAGDDAAEALWMDADLQMEEESGEEGTAAGIEGPAGAERAAGIEKAPERERWRLRLTNESHHISLGAVVEITVSGHPLLRQETYRLAERDGLAVDHGCLIVQALLRLKEALKQS